MYITFCLAVSFLAPKRSQTNYPFCINKRNVLKFWRNNQPKDVKMYDLPNKFVSIKSNIIFQT